jgi:integrase
MARRERLEPGIKERGKGKYLISIYTGRTINGKRERAYQTITGTIADANQKRHEMLGNLHTGTFTLNDKTTVSQHLQAWLKDIRINKRKRTYLAYESIVRCNLEPEFGSLKLRDLTTAMILDFYMRSQRELNKYTGKPTSPRTILHWHRILSEALTDAVDKGLLMVNVAPKGKQFTKRVTVNKYEAHPMQPDEWAKFEEVNKDSDYFPAVYMTVKTGLRISELLALDWQSVDLDLMMTIVVSRTLYKVKGETTFEDTKTKESKREIPMTPKLALFLRQYKAERESRCLQLGRILQPTDLLFTTINDKPLHPSVVTHQFQKMCIKAGIPQYRFHDLRHQFASDLIDRDVPAKVISTLMGHSSITITLDTYSHLYDNKASVEIAKLDDVPSLKK